MLVYIIGLLKQWLKMATEEGAKKHQPFQLAINHTVLKTECLYVPSFSLSNIPTANHTTPSVFFVSHQLPSMNPFAASHEHDRHLLM
jgi:hypothetical protein